VRDHFLGWLRSERPALADDYERRYRRAYLPSAEQTSLAERVRRFADAARGEVPVIAPALTRGLTKGHEPPLAGSGPPPPGPPARQLDLGL
jgi:hypothetical protein